MKKTFTILVVLVFIMGCKSEDDFVPIDDAGAYFFSANFGYNYVPYSDSNLTVSTIFGSSPSYVAILDTAIVKQEVKKFIQSDWIFTRNVVTTDQVSAILFNHSMAVFQFIIPVSQDGSVTYYITTVYRRDWAEQQDYPNITDELLWILD